MNILENGVFYFPAENRESDNNINREAIINCANNNNNREEANSFSQNDVLAFSGFEKSQSSGHKRKLQQPFDSLITIDRAKKTSYVGNKQKKKSRCAEAHNLSERLRRQKFKERMDVLREIIPNCDKKDKVSIVDDAIAHIRMLHDQLQMISMRGTSSSQCQCHSPLMEIPNYIPTDPNFLHTAVRGVNGMGSSIGMGIGMPDMFPSSNYPMTKQLELTGTCFWDSSTSPGIGMGTPDVFPSTNSPMTNQLELPSTCSLDSSTTPGTGMGMLDMFPSTNFAMTNQLDIPSTCSWDSSTTPVTGMGTPDVFLSTNFSMTNQLELPSTCSWDSSTTLGTGMGMPDVFSSSNYPMTNQLELPSESYLDSSTNPGISRFPILPDISDAGLYGVQNVGISDVLEPFEFTTSCPIGSPPHGMRELSPTHVINQESLGRGNSCTVRGSKARDTQ